MDVRNLTVSDVHENAANSLKQGFKLEKKPHATQVSKKERKIQKLELEVKKLKGKKNGNPVNDKKLNDEISVLESRIAELTKGRVSDIEQHRRVKNQAKFGTERRAPKRVIEAEEPVDENELFAEELKQLNA